MIAGHTGRGSRPGGAQNDLGGDGGTHGGRSPGHHGIMPISGLQFSKFWISSFQVLIFRKLRISVGSF